MQNVSCIVEKKTGLLELTLLGNNGIIVTMVTSNYRIIDLYTFHWYEKI